MGLEAAGLIALVLVVAYNIRLLLAARGGRRTGPFI